MNDSLISKPMDASEIAQMVNLYSRSGSKRTVLDELQRGVSFDLRSMRIARTEEINASRSIKQ